MFDQFCGGVLHGFKIYYNELSYFLAMNIYFYNLKK